LCIHVSRACRYTGSFYDETCAEAGEQIYYCLKNGILKM
jgi:hypothetical protein